MVFSGCCFSTTICSSWWWCLRRLLGALWATMADLAGPRWVSARSSFRVSLGCSLAEDLPNPVLNRSQAGRTCAAKARPSKPTRRTSTVYNAGLPAAAADGGSLFFGGKRLRELFGNSLHHKLQPVTFGKQHQQRQLVCRQLACLSGPC